MTEDTYAEAIVAPGQRDRVEAFLDARQLGTGPVRIQRIGDGASNLTYLLEREGARVVLRRPPPPPWPPTAHDVVREARIQAAMADAGARVARVLAICEDESVIGVPFFVMEEVRGVVPTSALPDAFAGPAMRQGLGNEVVNVLAELHVISWEAPELFAIGRPEGYLARQLRRWTQLWGINATRTIPRFDQIADRLRRTMPQQSASTVVHGDFRLGNVMVGLTAPPRVVAVLDWELATIGDPLADLGYLTSTWSEPGCDDHPLLLSPVTMAEGFPSRKQLIDRYSSLTGADVSNLAWYEGLALLKGAVFCEAIYGRWLTGARSDPWAASLAAGVPRLIDLAAVRL